MRRVNAGSPGASPLDPVARNSQSLNLQPRSSPAGTRPSLLPRSPLPHAANPHKGAVPMPLAPGGARPAWKGLFTVQSHDVCAGEDAVESWKIDPLLSVHLCILWSRACEVKPVINTERTSQFHLPVRSPDAAKAQAHLPHRPNPGCFISI